MSSLCRKRTLIHTCHPTGRNVTKDDWDGPWNKSGHENLDWEQIADCRLPLDSATFVENLLQPDLGHNTHAEDWAVTTWTNWNTDEAQTRNIIPRKKTPICHSKYNGGSMLLIPGIARLLKLAVSLQRIDYFSTHAYTRVAYLVCS